MCKSRRLIDRQIRHKKESLAFFSNQRKVDREVTACRAFLCAAGISFTAAELLRSPSEPPDVVFREARFELVESLDSDRRRSDELKAELQRLFRMSCDCELWSDLSHTGFIDATALVEVVTNSLTKKIQHYAENTCAALDALVYVNHLSTTLDCRVEHVDFSESTPWRSVSALIPPYAVVLASTQNAPTFLRERVGQVLLHWEDPTLFEAYPRNLIATGPPRKNRSAVD